MKLFDVNIKALQQDMSFRLKRQNLISSNLANVNTPGFQAKDIDFQDALKEIYQSEEIKSDDVEMVKTNSEHLDVKEDDLPDGEKEEKYIVQAPGIDENGVDLDREMARMTENSIMYTASSIAIKKKLGMLKYAIIEGGK